MPWIRWTKSMNFEAQRYDFFSLRVDCLLLDAQVTSAAWHGIPSQEKPGERDTYISPCVTPRVKAGIWLRIFGLDVLSSSGLPDRLRCPLTRHLECKRQPKSESFLPLLIR